MIYLVIDNQLFCRNYSMKATVQRAIDIVNNSMKATVQRAIDIVNYVIVQILQLLFM